MPVTGPARLPATRRVALHTPPHADTVLRTASTGPLQRSGTLSGQAQQPALQMYDPIVQRVPRDNQGENVATIKMRMPRRLAAL